MPDNENTLGFEDLFRLDDLLGEVLSVVLYLCPHIIDHEWLREVVFVVGKRHCLKVQGHRGSALKIAKLVPAGGGVGVGVEEPGNRSTVFREVWAVKTLVPLLIVVNNVVSIWREELAQLFVGENSIENHDLIHNWFTSLISYARQSCHREEGEVELPDQRLVEHQEREASPGDQRTSPSIVRPVQA